MYLQFWCGLVPGLMLVSALPRLELEGSWREFIERDKVLMGLNIAVPKEQSAPGLYTLNTDFAIPVLHDSYAD